jgi:DNA (cytosine-5)-methyltransferase 1
MGYHRAGFDEIVGIDIHPQPRYPFTFVRGDALAYGRSFGAVFDAIHASPPCQKYSWAAKRWRVERADLMPATFTLLDEIGVPFVVENVIAAPFRHAIVLCGTQFGLDVIRHRLFESNHVVLAPGAPCTHHGTVRAGHYVTVAGHGGDNRKGRGSRAVKQAAMGINWMSDQELNQAIPPAYTEWIGRQLLHIARDRDA